MMAIISCAQSYDTRQLGPACNSPDLIRLHIKEGRIKNWLTKKQKPKKYSKRIAWFFNIGNAALTKHVRRNLLRFLFFFFTGIQGEISFVSV